MPHDPPVAGPGLTGHLILVGLPGAGKTTVGRALARRLGVPFVDFDQVIAGRVGLPVAAIFAERGEAAFRALEVALTDELATAPPSVLAPGGGWVTNPGVIDRLRPPARLVHLRVSPEASVARLRNSRTVRPLIQGPDPLAVVRRLWEDRRELYATADWVVDAEVVQKQQLAAKIAALARRDHPGLG